jgi:methionyl aminopeptidase
MIKLKSSREADLMRRAGKIAAAARALAGEMVTAGVTTKQIDTAVHDFIISSGAVPTFLNFNGFPRQHLCVGQRTGDPRHSGRPGAL